MTLLESYFHSESVAAICSQYYGGGGDMEIQIIYCVKDQSQWAIFQILRGTCPLSPGIAAHVPSEIFAGIAGGEMAGNRNLGGNNPCPRNTGRPATILATGYTKRNIIRRYEKVFHSTI